jgi:hypothetical protein
MKEFVEGYANGIIIGAGLFGVFFLAQIRCILGRIERHLRNMR